MLLNYFVAHRGNLMNIENCVMLLVYELRTTLTYKSNWFDVPKVQKVHLLCIIGRTNMAILKLT